MKKATKARERTTKAYMVVWPNGAPMLDAAPAYGSRRRAERVHGRDRVGAFHIVGPILRTAAGGKRR